MRVKCFILLLFCCGIDENVSQSPIQPILSQPSSNCSLVGPCQPGYIFVNGKCEIPNAKCPENHYYSNGFCYPMESQKIVPLLVPTVVPYEIDIPVPETLEPENVTEIVPIKTTTRKPVITTQFTTSKPQTTTTEKLPVFTTRTTTTEKPAVTTINPPTSTTESSPCSVQTPIPPKTIIINHVNTVDRPNTVHVKHENNIFVHIKKGKNGKSIIIKNGNLTVYEDQTTTKRPTRPTTENPDEEEYDEEDEKCCTVVSPRMCRKQENEWVCFHRKHQACGPFCTSETIYLKPRRPTNRPPYLVMPPRPMFPLGGCSMGYCPPTDCSGCMTGYFRCSPACYRYDCVESGCPYVDEEAFCREYEVDGCDKDDYDNDE